MAGQPRFKKQEGVILVVTLVAMLVMTLLVSTMLRSSVVQMQIASNEKFAVQTFANVEGILDDVTAKLDALGRGGAGDACPVRFFYLNSGTFVDGTGCAIIDPNQDLADNEAQCPGSTAATPTMYALTARDCTIINTTADAAGKYTAINSASSGDCSPGGVLPGNVTVCGRTTLTLCTCTDQNLSLILQGIAQTYGYNPDGSPRVTISWVPSISPPTVVAGMPLVAADGTLAFEQPVYKSISREYYIKVTVASAIVNARMEAVSQARGAARTVKLRHKVDF